jgi:AraC-like DNA-binding protein
MKYFDYREHRQQGTFEFPIAFYHITPNHPRYQMPYHWHPEYEIIRIIEGKFNLTLDSKTYLVKEGDILFLQDGILHGGIPENCIYDCLVFDFNLLLKDNHISTKLIQKIIRHEVAINQQLPNNIQILNKSVEKLFLTVSGRKNGYEFITLGYLYQIVGIIIEKHLYEENAAAAQTTFQHVLQFKKVLSFIENHYTEHISLEDMAKVAGMNAKYFCKFFREMSYRTPIDYLNYYRIECACEQLATTRAAIIEVAFNCGFNDLSYFIKTFRKYKGITPKQYLKKQ